MTRTLNPRERFMALAVGVILFALLNLIGFSLFRSGQRQRQEALDAKRASRDELRSLLAGRALWDGREQWLAAHQPRLENRDRAAVALLEEIKAVARERNVLLENPQLGTIEAGPQRQAVSVNVETRSSWEALIKLLSTLEQPEKFIVLETANLQIDSSDPTRMRGRFRIARWYAP